MQKKEIYTENAPPIGGPYSQAISFGSLIFTSGQIAMKPGSKELVTGDIRAETVQVLENLRAILEAANSDFDHVLKTTIYVSDMKKFPEVNEVYAGYFKGVAPARTRVEVSELPREANVEIELIAYSRATTL
jgi:2-iminobutanoate/2-iminopropanoate deaminase